MTLAKTALYFTVVAKCATAEFSVSIFIAEKLAFSAIKMEMKDSVLVHIYKTYTVGWVNFFRI